MRYIYFIILVHTLISCDNLNRNNPVDQNNDDYFFNSNDTNQNINDDEINLIDPDKPNIIIQSVTITAEDYNDNAFNPGEKIKLAFVLANNGAQDALGVQVMFNCNNLYINNFNPTSWVVFSSTNAISNPNISSGSTATAPLTSDEVEFEIASTAPVNTPIEIELIIKDENSNTWRQTFKTTIKAAPAVANLKFSRYTIGYEEFIDGVITKGERVRIRPFVLNVGNVICYEPKLTITTAYPNINILYTYNKKSIHEWDNSSGWLVHPNKEARPSFTSGELWFEVSNLTSTPYDAVFDVIIEDAAGRVFIDTFKITIY